MHGAEIVFNKEIAPGVFRMRARCPAASGEARPGQFIMLRVSDQSAPLLRRPFSLCGTEGETIEIIYRVAGKGTAIMSSWKEPQEIHFIGPLGTGFSIAGDPQTVFLVAGGMGIAPLLLLLRYLEERHPGVSRKIYLGGKTADDVRLLDDFKPLPEDIVIATEDGAAGFRGLVTDLFAHQLGTCTPRALQKACIFSCGPPAMARVVAAIAARRGISCQLSLEANMACGIGACLGCAVKTRSHAGVDAADGRAFHYQRVCAEGPVFDSRELVWDDE
jgi:dihydroorotate dehydrogenase electron transfer subunit